MKPIPDPWAIEATDFPETGTPADKWEFLLRYAMLAPSTHNSQPWLFHLKGVTLELHGNPRQACPVVDPDHRERFMSCGCALFHLRCALRHFGWLGPVTRFPDPRQPDYVARLDLALSPVIRGEETTLFHAMARRRTNRQPFDSTPVPPSLLEALAQAAAEEGAWFHVVGDESARNSLAELVSEGDRRQWADPEFRRELAHWIHNGRNGRRDGIPGFAQAADDLLSSTEAAVVRTFDMGDGQAARDHDVAIGSPVLAVLGTDHDDPLSWVNAGEALARVLLRARVDHVWGSFLNQPVELPDLRRRLGTLLGRGGHPQAVLRLGFGRDVRPTPRRELDEVLV